MSIVLLGWYHLKQRVGCSQKMQIALLLFPSVDGMGLDSSLVVKTLFFKVVSQWHYVHIFIKISCSGGVIRGV
jgi:hypothetical protein